MFLKNNKAIGVNNGETGTVLRISALLSFQSVTVKLDDGSKVTVPLKDYQHMTLGYACTTHKGQGSTVERAYVLAGGKMQDRELSLVQISRARTSTRIYTDEREAGKDLRELARQMEEERQKTLAMTQQLTLGHRP
jgi:ATP-dependent exoDNAse (exonuclease V) alpha subunit